MNFKLSKRFLIMILLFISLFNNISNANHSLNISNQIINQTEINNSNAENLLEKKLDISSDAAILIDSKSGNVLYSKNTDKSMYPASTTKILTAILVLENCNLNDIVTVSYNAISLIPPGYSSAYLSEGEQISVRDLLELLLIHSSNDAANVLAEHVSKSIDDFVTLMNNKAKTLGCTNSHFVNTNGIHNKNHYTTAEDLAIIAKYCMQNDVFREIVSMDSCTIPATNKSTIRTYPNTNDSLLKTSKYYRKDCIGIKTGYTSQAKQCIISSCSNGEVELLAVVLHSPSLADRYTDLDTLYNYGYEILPLLQANTETINSEEINNSEKNTVNVEYTSANSEKSTYEQSYFDELTDFDIFIIILIILSILMILILISLLIYNYFDSKKYN